MGIVGFGMNPSTFLVTGKKSGSALKNGHQRNFPNAIIPAVELITASFSPLKTMKLLLETFPCDSLSFRDKSDGTLIWDACNEDFDKVPLRPLFPYIWI
jgi:hypothetical protein